MKKKKKSISHFFFNKKKKKLKNEARVEIRNTTTEMRIFLYGFTVGKGLAMGKRPLTSKKLKLK